MTTNAPKQFEDFSAYMRFAIRETSNCQIVLLEVNNLSQNDAPNGDELVMPEYPAPVFQAASTVHNHCTAPAGILPNSEPARSEAMEQLHLELKNSLALGIAKSAIVKWTDQVESRLDNIEIPARVWRDFDELTDLPKLWTTGFMKVEFPKGFENGQLAMRGEVLFFDVRFRRELVSIAETHSIARTRATQYDWQNFEAEAKRLILDEGGFQLGYGQVKCESQMTNWCALNWGKIPSEASIRTHVKNAEKEYLAEYRGQSS